MQLMQIFMLQIFVSSFSSVACGLLLLLLLMVLLEMVVRLLLRLLVVRLVAAVAELSNIQLRLLSQAGRLVCKQRRK